ncbi:MAG: hypothetical protein HYX76_12835 [Acidobacteria bacterium]|nr:hypothetical protein [Acidobacteriota bacterium]
MVQDVNEKSADLLDAALHDVLRAVDQAAQLARWIQRRAPRPHEKRDKTPLTVADLAVQVVLASALERAFPGDPLVAEEDASTLGGETGSELAKQMRHFVRPLLPALTPVDLLRFLGRGAGSPARRFWVLDPVDGTEGFLRGGHYVVALALLEDYHPTVAMLGCPTLDGAGLGKVAREPGHGREPGLLLVARRGRGTWISAMDAAEFQPIRVSEV